MNFKYHNGYKGYYLQENNKYVRPFKKLDEEETKIKLKDKEIELNFDKNLVIEVPSEFVVFENKNEIESINNKSKLASNANLSDDNKYKNFSYAPSEITNDFIKFIQLNEGNDNRVFSILEILENVFYSDYSLRNKAKKLFYYSEKDIKLFLKNYLPFKNVNEELKENIIKNYPSQYIYEHLPLDYKEVEMVYVFYFIILVELLSILK